MAAKRASTDSLAPGRAKLSSKEIMERMSALRDAQRTLNKVRSIPSGGLHLYTSHDGDGNNRITLPQNSHKRLIETLTALAEDDYGSHLAWFDENGIEVVS